MLIDIVDSCSIIYIVDFKQAFAHWDIYVIYVMEFKKVRRAGISICYYSLHNTPSTFIVSNNLSSAYAIQLELSQSGKLCLEE